MENKEIVWVDSKLAERYKKIESDENRYKVFEEYLKTVAEESQRDFRANLEGLEEDVAIYTGLMLKVKQSFKKAKDEQLDASYELWEGFEKEIPSIQQKTAQIISTLNPLSKMLDEINSKLKSIDTYGIERMNETLRSFQNLSGKGSKIFEFIVNNFKDQ